MSPPRLPTIEELRARAQPSEVLSRPNAEHWMGRRLRRFSVHLTRAAIRLGVSANTVTGLMIVVGLGAAAAFSAPGWWALLGAVGIQCYLLLDCSDGEIARWHGTESAVGVYLDRLGNYLVEAAIPIAVGLRVGGWGANGWLVLAMSTSIAIVLSKAETDLVDMARHQAGMARMADEARAMRPRGLAAARQVVAKAPFHRIVHAVEASMLLAVTIVVDELAGGDTWTRGLLIALAVSAWLTAALHLVSVLTSRRLTAE